MQIHLLKMKLSTDTLQMTKLIKRHNRTYQVAMEDTRRKMVDTHLKTMNQI